MNRPLAVILAVLALLTLTAFILGGATLDPERAPIPAIARGAGGLAGHPLAPALAALLALLALGLGLQTVEQTHKDDKRDDDQRPAEERSRLPLTEAALVACAGLALLFLGYVALGVAGGWGVKTLGLLFAAAAIECTLAIALGIVASLKRPRANRLYALGGAMTAVSLAVLGAVIVFMQG